MAKLVTVFFSSRGSAFFAEGRVNADTHDDVVDLFYGRVQLRQDPDQLLVADQNIVGPLDAAVNEPARRSTLVRATAATSVSLETSIGGKVGRKIRENQIP